MRVVIAEDSVILREGLARILADEGFQVIAVSGPGELLDCIELESPHIAIIDVRMPPTHTDEGIQAAIEIRRRGPTTPVLLFSQYIETTRAIDLLQSGTAGFGYLLKDRVLDVDDFVDAVRRVAHGGTAIDPLIVAALVANPHPPDQLASLSARELEVLGLMAQGLTNTAIAAKLRLARRTVETHIGSLFTKLDLLPTEDDHRRVRAVLAYLNRGPSPRPSDRRPPLGS
jgi:DNA-binding NarL/FixJ family response regulator